MQHAKTAADSLVRWVHEQTVRSETNCIPAPFPFSCEIYTFLSFSFSLPPALRSCSLLCSQVSQLSVRKRKGNEVKNSGALLCSLRAKRASERERENGSRANRSRIRVSACLSPLLRFLLFFFPSSSSSLRWEMLGRDSGHYFLSLALPLFPQSKKACCTADASCSVTQQQQQDSQAASSAGNI